YPSHRNRITCIVGLLDPKKSGSSQLRKWASQKLIGLLRGKPNQMGWSLTWKAQSKGQLLSVSVLRSLLSYFPPKPPQRFALIFYSFVVTGILSISVSVFLLTL
ncbi:hypothetical protein SDJN02_07413, partial [Cucurbita argyrosperma subsp. argyrosperma]